MVKNLVWQTNYLGPLKRDLERLKQKDTLNILLAPYSTSENPLSQLIHVHIELLLLCQKFVRYMIVKVALIDEFHSNSKFPNYLPDDTDEIHVDLILFQLPLRIIPVNDNAIAVAPCSC